VPTKTRRDDNQGPRFRGFRMKRLSDPDELECDAGDQLNPALDRAKEPWSRIREIFAEACPGSLAPPVDVWLVSTGNQRMQCLNHQRSAGVEQRRRAA